jgi:uncharacterized protein (DUF433 family)
MDTTMKYKHLAPKPRSSYRQLFVKGTGIAARTLYGQHVNAEEPRTIEQLADDFHIPVEAVREAVAYCQSKPPEIEEDWRMDELVAELSGMNDADYSGRPKPLSDEDFARIRSSRGQ